MMNWRTFSKTRYLNSGLSYVPQTDLYSKRANAHIAADWLQEHTALDDFKIKATLSGLPDDWPRDE